MPEDEGTMPEEQVDDLLDGEGLDTDVTQDEFTDGDTDGALATEGGEPEEATDAEPEPEPEPEPAREPQAKQPNAAGAPGYITQKFTDDERERLKEMMGSFDPEQMLEAQTFIAQREADVREYNQRLRDQHTRAAVAPIRAAHPDFAERYADEINEFLSQPAAASMSDPEEMKRAAIGWVTYRAQQSADPVAALEGVVAALKGTKAAPAPQRRAQAPADRTPRPAATTMAVTRDGGTAERLTPYERMLVNGGATMEEIRDMRRATK